MELLKVLEERKSYRAFKSLDVQKEKIEDIIQYAVYAPSARNLQPWEFVVVTGRTKELLSKKLVDLQRQKVTTFGSRDESLPEIIQQRMKNQMEERSRYYKQVGIELPPFNTEGSLNFHGAPVAIFICIDDRMKSNSLDIGITLTYLLLAAHGMGLGTCPIGVVNMYEKEIKEILAIPEGKRIVISVALGYPDFDNPICGYKSHRDLLSNFLSWK
jgi:nitroreductase